MIFLSILGGVTLTVIQMLTILDLCRLGGMQPLNSVISFVGSMPVFDLSIIQMDCAVGNSPTMSYFCQLCMWTCSVFVLLLGLGLGHRFSDLWHCCWRSYRRYSRGQSP